MDLLPVMTIILGFIMGIGNRTGLLWGTGLPYTVYKTATMYLAAVMTVILGLILDI